MHLAYKIVHTNSANKSAYNNVKKIAVLRNLQIFKILGDGGLKYLLAE